MSDLHRRDFCSGRNLARLGFSFFDSLRQGIAEAVTPSTQPSAHDKPAPDRQIPLHRPPGAIDETAFLERCTSCLDCAQACPHGSIVAAPIRFREAAGTPIIQPIEQPCFDCADRPCAAACPSGALDPLLPSRMAMASIDQHSCVAAESFCQSCFERCPIEGAIVLDGHQPRISAERCSGCGVCQHVCPAPHNAIRLLPIMERAL